MKLKCNSCGKREAEYMSKAEIKVSNFIGVDSSTTNKIIDLVEKLFSPDYKVCKACGHVEKS